MEGWRKPGGEREGELRYIMHQIPSVNVIIWYCKHLLIKISVKKSPKIEKNYWRNKDLCHTVLCVCYFESLLMHSFLAFSPLLSSLSLSSLLSSSLFPSFFFCTRTQTQELALARWHCTTDLYSQPSRLAFWGQLLFLFLNGLVDIYFS